MTPALFDGDPNAAWRVLAAGVAGICVEVVWPGWIVPAAAGSALVVLGVVGLSAWPLNPPGVGLLAGGLALLGLARKAGARGAWVTIAGAAGALIAGAAILVDSPGPVTRIQPATVWGAIAPVVLWVALLMVAAARARRNKADPREEGKRI